MCKEQAENPPAEMRTEMRTAKQSRNKTTRSLMQLNLRFLMLAFMLELTACAVHFSGGGAEPSAPPYLLYHILLPSAINFVLYIGGGALLSRKSAGPMLLQYVPVVLCALLCFNISLWHSDYILCRALFLVPVFLTVIFTDKKMTRLITLLSLVLLALSDAAALLLRAERPRPEALSCLFWIVSGLCIFIFAYSSSLVIIDSIQKKNKKIEESMDIRNRLAEELNHDHLTGLLSLGAYEKLMIDYTAEAETNGTPLCMAIIDIDHFKKVNDNYGHAQGNVVLVALAELLQRHCAGSETVARYGGEEFVIFFPNTDVAVAFARLDEMRRAFGELAFDFLPEGARITFSAGLASYPGNKYSNAFFFELADKALYEAKDAGRNCIRVQKI